MKDCCSNVVELTKQLINIESTNPGKYETKIGEFIFDCLEDCGAFLEKSEVFPGRSNIRAVLKGQDTKQALVFICHMDTVVKGDGWTKEAFLAEEDQERIYGRGACDMKSGLACALATFLATAKRVKETSIVLQKPLVFIGTVDEEGDMNGVEKVIKDGWVSENDLVLDMEPTDGQLQMAHKGRTWFEVEVQGTTAHASMPEKGADAIAAMAEIISYVRSQIEKCPTHLELGKSTVTFGMIDGGYSPYVVPDHCKVTMDLRLVPPMCTEKAEEMLCDAISVGEKNVPGIKCVYKITGDRPALEINENSLLMVELKKAIKEITGKSANVSTFPGYTDTAVIAGKLQNKNCMSYGPGMLKLAHKPDEYVKKVDIERCYKVFLKLVENLLTDGRAL